MSNKIVALPGSPKDLLELAELKFGDNVVQALSANGDGNDLLQPKGALTDWVSDSKAENPGISFYFPRHSVCLESYSFVISQKPALIPNGWALFGFTGVRWEFIACVRPNAIDIKPNSVVSFAIDKENQNTKYNYIRLCSLNGPFSLHAIRFYGTLQEGGLDMTPAILSRGGLPDIDPEKPQTITAQYEPNVQIYGVIEHAFKHYGPDLFKFVTIYSNNDPKSYPNDLLRLRNKSWISGESEYPGFTYYFPNHSVSLNKYVIENPSEGPFIGSFAILGITENDTNGEIIDTQTLERKPNATFLIPVPTAAQSKRYRGFRFLSTSGKFSLAFFDFYGSATPDQTHPIPENDIKSYYIPSEISSKVTTKSNNADDSYQVITKETPKAETPHHQQAPQTQQTVSTPQQPVNVEIDATNIKDKDLFEQGSRKYGPEFVQVWSSAEDSDSLIHGNPNNFFISDSKGAHPTVAFYFPKRSIRLQKYHLAIPLKPSAPLLQNWILFGYTGTTWEILDHRKTSSSPLKQGTTYEFEIKPEYQHHYFNVLRFCSLSGIFSLSYIKIFGLLTSKELPIIDSVLNTSGLPSIVPEKPFSIANRDEPVLETAQAIYGPRLDNFAVVYSSCQGRGEDLWNLTGKPWKSEVSKFPVFTIYFPNHSVQISKYLVVSPTDGPCPKSWTLIGVSAENPDGEIIDYGKSSGKPNMKMECQVKQEFQSNRYRAIRFISTSGQFSLSRFEFYGIVTPENSQIDQQSLLRFKIPAAAVKFAQA